MSAMHWEARRRQNALQRRMVRDQQQLLQTDAETSSNATESNTTKEQTVHYQIRTSENQRSCFFCNSSTPAGGRCPYCKADLKTPVHHSAKLANRYSSLQYTQQW